MMLANIPYTTQNSLRNLSQDNTSNETVFKRYLLLILYQLDDG